MTEYDIPEGLTFDDLLLVPARSEVLPSDVDVSTYLTNSIKAECSGNQCSHGHGHRG